MSSPDRRKRRARERHAGAAAKAAARAAGNDESWEQAQSFDPNEPWDARAAEALTRLCESEEGNLRRPATRERAPHADFQAKRRKGGWRTAGGMEAIDRTWLESHLSRLAKRLQRSLAQSSSEQSLAALSERLDAIEERFGTALGRVAQRSDLDGLKSIEADVMELAAQLDRARDRLDQLGAVDDEVRDLARHLDEAGERRAAALEKLLRDCVAEWREGEQRTAGALHNLEEAVNRLGDSVDAMEASKPAPDLTVHPLASPDLERSVSAVGAMSQPHVGGDLSQTAHFYHAMLDAADYAPKPVTEGRHPPDPPALTATGEDLATLPAAAVEWSVRAADSVADHGAGATLTSGGWEIAALRAKLRQTPGAAFPLAPEESLADAEQPAAETSKRSSLGLLLMAGAAILASSTYFLYQAVVAPLPPARPAETQRGAQAVGKPELADPSDRRTNGEGAT